MAADRVAILGGGIGSLTTAYQLARQRDPDGAPKYAVTVYQMGWRLGGKLATSRNQDPGKGFRIEEHGIHGFMGSYYNAGEMMSEVYSDLASIEDLQGFYTSFDAAFDRQDSVVMWEHRKGEWVPWPMTLKRNDRDFEDLDSVSQYQNGMVEILRLLGIHLSHPTLGLREKIEDFFLEELIGHLQKMDPELDHVGEKVVDLTANVWSHLRPLLEASKLPESNDGVRRAVIVADFACALLKGFFADRIPEKGYAHIDGEDYSDWLRRHGAAEATIRSPFSLNTPDITYNFPRGDMTVGPRMSAASFVQWTFRLFGYVGSFVLPFRAGSGETVLAPLYRALKEHGVRFEFFHKVTELNLSADRTRVESIDFDIQATLVGDAGRPEAADDGSGGGEPEYQPLFGPVKGLMCWPSHPLYDQLVEGKELAEADVDLESWWTPWKPVARKTIRAGDDFDHVVCGISLGGLRYICPQMLEDDTNPPLVTDSESRSRWRLMVDEIETVQTQAMQLWFQDPVSEYLDSSVTLPEGEDWIAGTYVLPISGQADFTKLLDVEDWPEDGPRGLFYLCGPMADSGIPPFDETEFPILQRERVKAQCIQYLEAASSAMLPGASTELRKRPTTPGSLDFDRLYVTPEGGSAEGAESDGEPPTGERRFDFQFWRANIDPTERYVTCLPGDARYRLKASESGYGNLTLTGDWIDTGLNVGSVEGAVMGGKLASWAISGTPVIRDIYGYDPFGLKSSPGE